MAGKDKDNEEDNDKEKDKDKDEDGMGIIYFVCVTFLESGHWAAIPSHYPHHSANLAPNITFFSHNIFLSPLRIQVILGYLSKVGFLKLTRA